MLGCHIQGNKFESVETNCYFILSSFQAVKRPWPHETPSLRMTACPTSWPCCSSPPPRGRWGTSSGTKYYFLYFQAEFDSFAEKLRRWSAEFQYILNVCSFTLVFRSKGVRVRKGKMACLPPGKFFLA
jgi:hypothetical protein